MPLPNGVENMFREYMTGTQPSRMIPFPESLPKIKCFGCNHFFKVKNTCVVKDKIYCKNCAYEISYCCHSCCKRFLKNEIILELYTYYCKKCYDTAIKPCVICNKKVNTITKAYGADNKIYCNECWKERFDFCHKCGHTFWKEDLRLEENGDTYCERCWSLISVIHDYSYNPSPKFLNLTEQKGNSKNLYMGLELEVSYPEKIEDKGKKLKAFLEKINVCGMYYLKHDSSIQGFEIVTHPFTLEYGIKYMKLKEILDWLKFQGFLSNNDCNCGLHIHFNEDFFNMDNKTKLRIFINRYKQLLFKLSGRKEINNEFCVYEKYNLQKFLSNIKQKGRHWALNMNTSKGTMELRIFVGTLNLNILLGALEFVHCLSYFLQNKTLVYVSNGHKSQELWNDFLSYVQKHKYSNLYLLMKRRKLCV